MSSVQGREHRCPLKAVRPYPPTHANEFAALTRHALRSERVSLYEPEGPNERGAPRRVRPRHGYPVVGRHERSIALRRR
jgi:hypothetical protein